jgi:hypothetical protein
MVGKINKKLLTEPAASETRLDHKEKHRRHHRLINALLLLFIIIVFYIFKVASYYPAKIDLKHRTGFFGVTFSTKYCEELGLGWKETYRAILDELNVKLIRLPIYWDEIEKEPGVFDFANYDYLINAGADKDAKFIISIGRRVPRWPECHSPAWLNSQTEAEVKADTLKMLQTIVERYRGNSSVEYWQVENEPFLGAFGVCPPLDADFLKKEFELVRSLDSRPVIITGSGELGLWKKEAKIGDIFGSTLYRVVYNRWFGVTKYPFPYSFYRLKAKFSNLMPERLMVLELQAEPWVPEGKMIYLTSDEIKKTMSLQQFRANLQYSINLNFSRTYIWGVEWWYWQKKYGNPEYWQIAETLFD